MKVPVVRGIRGAISVPEDSRPAILDSTKRLLQKMQEANGFSPDELASIFFTVTPDLSSAFPPEAARQLGWNLVPLLTAVEMSVPSMPPRIVRVLIHWNTTRTPEEIVHVYLDEARQLRPDLINNRSVSDKI